VSSKAAASFHSTSTRCSDPTVSRDGWLLVLWLNCQSVVCICGDLCCAFAFSEDGEGQSLSEIWPRGIPVISLCRPMQPSDLSKRLLRVLSALLAWNFGPTLAVLCRKTRHQTMSVCILARFVCLVAQIAFVILVTTCCI
jgi:hypothetical protein